MVANTPTLADIETLADWHERLGHVPLFRVRFHPHPGTATEADVIRFAEATNKRLYELVDGTLVEKAVGFRESVIGSFLGQRIGLHVTERDLGITAGPDGAFRLGGGQVRYPDVSFVRWQDVPGEALPDEKLSNLVPTLAVEVLSESNTVGEITRKRREFFDRGCKLFWVIDPETATAEVYTSFDRMKLLDATGTLDGGKVLPGFSIPLADVFAVGTRPRRKRKG